MAKRKKRKSVTLILLLLVLVALLGVYFWYSNHKAKEEETKEEATTSLVKVEDSNQFTTLHYIYQSTDMTFVKEENTWKLQSDPVRPIKQMNISDLLGLLKEINAIRTIAEKAENLEDYGLAKPVAYLKGLLADGSTVTLSIGNEVTTGDGYYALVNEDGKVYQIDITYGPGLQFTDSDMTATEEAPRIEVGSIRQITIDHRDGEDFEVIYNENGGLDNSGSLTYPWHITQPYQSAYTANTTVVTTLAANYANLTYNSCVEYEAKDLSKYGLDNPGSSIYIGYNETRTEILKKPEKDPNTGEEITEKTVQEPKEYKLAIGNLDESGSNYYVIAEGSRAVYTMSADTINKMLTVDVFSLLNPFINIPNIDDVDQIDIDVDGKSYQITMEHKTVKNGEGKEEVQSKFYFDGIEANEKNFRNLYQILVGAKYDAEMKEAVNSDTAPRLSISYTLNDAKKTVVSASYLPYDDSFYSVATNGELRFFADKRRMDDIIKAIKEFDPKAPAPEE